MEQSEAGEMLRFTLSELAEEIGFTPGFTKHLGNKNGFNATVIDGIYHITEAELADIKVRRDKARRDLEAAFDPDAAAVARRALVIANSGVDEATAVRLGF